MNELGQLIDSVNERIGKAISWLTLLMMLTTCLVVGARYIFNVGSIALQESAMYLHGTVFMLGIAYTLKHQEHVRVDVLQQRFKQTKKNLVEIGGTILFLFPVTIFIFFTSLDYVQFSWSLSEGSAQPGGLPGVFLLKTLIPITALLVFLQGVAELIRAVSSIRSTHG